MITATVDTSGIRSMFADLARMAGKDFDHVVRPEAARIVERAIEYTPAAKPKKGQVSAKDEAERIHRTYGDRANEGDGSAKISVTKANGKVWWMEKDDRYVDKDRPRTVARVPHFHRMNDPRRRWNPQRWSAYRQLEMRRQQAIQQEQRRISDDRKAVKKARGLSKNSWYQIGRALHLPMRGIPNYVINASPSTGKVYVNGTGQEHGAGKKFFLVLENRYPALTLPKRPGMNGNNILQRAINTRLKAFEVNMQRGVYQDMKARAQRHPGVFVTA